MTTFLSRVLCTVTFLSGWIPASLVHAQIEIGVAQESKVTLPSQGDMNLKLRNGAYRSGRFVYASRHYVVIDPKTNVRPDIKKAYGGQPVEWSKIDTLRIQSLAIEIRPEGTTGDEIFRALCSIPGADVSTVEATEAYRDAEAAYLKKNPKKEEPLAATPVPGTAPGMEKPADGGRPDGVPRGPNVTVEVAATPIPAAAIPDAIPSAAPVESSAAAEAPAAVAQSPAPAASGPRVLTIPQTEVAPAEAQSFSFSSMSTGQQIGLFVGIIAALILVVKIL